MTIIKTTQQREMLRKFGIKYDPDKRIQYVFTLTNEGYYFKKIKETYIELFKLILSVAGVIITAPFLIIWGIKECLTSLLPYSLVYTRKHLKDDPLVVKAKFKEGD
ncbi:hypothetical protein [Clostridium kluyveri]|uniref:Uncharacterized protein n=1 Tax=Clostridium kluyveri TaxID=1534 RepID=A0A1L5F8W4_CLOKL|nr:hypothetical protein [Clostridium kluyveri]APM39413.1 hypothetical protein BS101_12000 [Clostridium kluyveri]